MNILLLLFISGLAAVQLLAATNEATIKLAIISESPETETAADVLTAEFSKDDQLHMLERAEIEKVFREQKLSLNNLDHMKLGQLLGADGLLALQFARAGTNAFLSAQLVAVKPGVLLTSERFKWPVPDVAAWSEGMLKHLTPLLPKLDVLAQEAIPISVVNLHSAVETTAAHELEQQLTFLIIERLTQEKRLFVLERKRMQMLTGEKENSGLVEQAFWNGSYLLDGTIDRNGSSPDFMTVNARLIPPKGGTPILIETQASRTNYVETVNQLADKIIEALKIKPNPDAWNATEEAIQYFNEAKWDLAWGFFPQARAAAEAAWALGKHDEESMNLRVRTFMPPPDGRVIYFPPRVKPDPEKIDDALHALELYQSFSQNLPPDEPKPDSAWYALGLDNLCIATRVLQQFNWLPEYYQPVADKLTDLRAASRSTAVLLSRSPSVHDSYFVGNRAVKYDDLYHFMEKESIYGLKLDGGCLWQETPEKTIALYRELMSSPVFCYLHRRLWFRDDFYQSKLPKLPPRLVAWNEADQKRIPAVWKGFTDELNNSTNIFLRMEAKALRLADVNTENDKELTDAFTIFLDAFVENRLAFKTSNVDVLYMDWSVDELVSHICSGIVTDTKESLQKRYRIEYGAKLAAKDEELRATVSAVAGLQAFEKQKAFLKGSQPFDPVPFVELFDAGFKDYSPAQAREIQPLLAEYKKQLSGTWASVGAMQIDDVEANVNHILSPSPSARMQQAFERQKQFLQEPKPFDPHTFVELFIFGFKDYSTNQALEILPLLAEYKKHLSGTMARTGATQVGQVEANVSRILNPTTAALSPATNRLAALSQNPGGPPSPAFSPVHPRRFGQPPNSHAPEPEPEPVPPPKPIVGTNIVTVKNFYPMPMAGLFGEAVHGFKFNDHQVVEGKLVLDFQYGAFVNSDGQNGNPQFPRNETFNGVAVFEPVAGRWQVTVLPDPEQIETRNDFPHHSTWWHGELYSSQGGKLQKFDTQRHVWQTAGLAVQGNYQLYNLDGHFYIADNNTIQEISDNGRSTKLLASIQRQPPASLLDTQGALKKLTLFADASHALRTSVHDKIFTWDGSDWHEDCAMPTVLYPESFADGVLFRSFTGLFRLATNSLQPEVCFSYEAHATAPPWVMPEDLFVVGLPATLRAADLYLVADHSELKTTVNSQHSVVKEDLVTKDGYHAGLLRFTPGEPGPKKILLKFEDPEGCPPLSAMNTGASQPFHQLPSTWMLFTGGQLCLGVQEPQKINFPRGLGHVIGTGHPPGIWEISTSEVDAAFATLSASTEILPDKQNLTTDPADEARRQSLLKLKQKRSAEESP